MILEKIKKLINYLFFLVIFFGGCNKNEKPPNILFIISDNQSYPHANIYDTKWLINPGFDRIADRGLLFNQTYTTDLFTDKAIQYR